MNMIEGAGRLLRIDDVTLANNAIVGGCQCFCRGPKQHKPISRFREREMSYSLSSAIEHGIHDITWFTGLCPDCDLDDHFAHTLLDEGSKDSIDECYRACDRLGRGMVKCV